MVTSHPSRGRGTWEPPKLQTSPVLGTGSQELLKSRGGEITSSGQAPLHAWSLEAPSTLGAGGLSVIGDSSAAGEVAVVCNQLGQ